MGVLRRPLTDQPAAEALAKAVFLDRDGVVNQPILRGRRPHPPHDMSEFVWMDGIGETLNALHSRGYLLLVFTNQPDVARGTQTIAQVDAFHDRVLAELPIQRVYTCPHDDRDGCTCRKPKPGMLHAGRDDYGLDLGRCWVVGDRWRDIEAGRAAGCKTILVRHAYDEPEAKADYEITRIPELLGIIT